MPGGHVIGPRDVTTVSGAVAASITSDEVSRRFTCSVGSPTVWITHTLTPSTAAGRALCGCEAAYLFATASERGLRRLGLSLRHRSRVARRDLSQLR